MLESIIMNYPDPMAIFGADGAIRKINGAASEYLKCTTVHIEKAGDALRAFHFHDEAGRLIPSEEAPTLKVLRGERLTDFRIMATYRDQTYYLDISGTPVYGRDGAVAYAVMFFRDVTEKIAAAKIIGSQANQLNAIIENMTDVLLIFDKDGRYTAINKAARQLILPLTDDLNTIGDSLRTMQYFDDRGALIPIEDIPPFRVMRGETLTNLRYGLKHRQGILYLDINGTPVYDEQGGFIAGIMSCRDVTAQVDTETQYRFLLDATQTGVVHQNADGTIVSMNPAAVRILGKSEEEFIGSSSVKEQRHTIREDGAAFPGLEHPAMVSLRTGAPVVNTVMGVYNPMRAEYRWIDINAVPMCRTGEEKPYQVFTVFDDITERKKAEDALKQSEALMRSVLENSHDIICRLNLQTKRFEYISPACTAITGFTPEEIMTADAEMPWELIHPDDIPGLMASLQKLDETDRLEHRYRQRTKNGDYRWFHNSMSVARDDAGNALYRYGSMRDITDLIRYEEATEYQAMLLQNISDIVVSTDENLRIKSWNKAAELTYGWSAEEVVGRIVGEFFQEPGHPEAYGEDIAKLFAAGTVDCEHVQTCKDGRVINVNSKVRLIRDAQGTVTGSVGIMRDITEQKRAEDALKQSEALMRSVLENSHDIIYRLNLRTKRFEYVSPASTAITGFTPEELITTHTGAMWDLIHPDDLPGFIASVQGLDKSGRLTLKYRQRTKSGEYRWLLNSMSVARDEAGNALYRYGSVHDITELVRYEETTEYQAMLLQNISDSVISTDENMRITSWNKAAELTYGWKADETIGKIAGEFLHESVGPETAGEEIDGLFRTGAADHEHTQTCKDGRLINVSGKIRLIRDAQGKVTGTVGIMRDITEQKRAEEALKQSEASLRAVLENANDLVYSLNTQTGQFEYVNPACTAVTGYTPEEYLEMNAGAILALIHPDDLLTFLTAYRGLEKTGRQELQYRQRKKNGEYQWVTNSMAVIKDDAGRVLRQYGNIRDVTDMRNAEEALKRSEERLRAVLDNSSDIIYSFNARTGQYDFVSAASEKVLGYTPEEFTGIDIEATHAMIHPDDLPEFLASLEKIEGSGTIELRYRQRRKDGEYRWLSNRLSLIRDGAGRIRYRNGIIHDITDQVRTENALRESALRLRLAAEGASLGTYAYDVINGTEFISDELKALWGLEPDEPVPMDDEGLFFKGMHPDDRQRFQASINAANNPEGDGVIDTDYRIIQRDGSIKWLHVKGLSTFIDTGRSRRLAFAAGVVIDITKRVMAENSVRELSEELRNIIESTEDYIYSVNKSFRLMFFNTAFGQYVKRSFGHELKIGDFMPDVMTAIPRGAWEEFYGQVTREGKIQVEIRIDEGDRVLSLSFNPVYIDAELVEITVFGKDITARIHSEREIIRLNASLEKRVLERTRELQKTVNALRNLSRVLSRDLKAPISEIEDFFSENAGHAEQLSAARTIRQACGAMSQMIEDLSAYALSSDRTIQKETVNIRKMIASVYNELKPTAGSSVLQYESGLPFVQADKVLLRQVLYNLISNALKFSAKRDVAEITVGCKEENYQYVFHIRDNGVGFDMRQSHKLFKVFERLHSSVEYSGTGVGLAAARNIIQRHGGRTWIESQAGLGTTVYFTLPVGDGE
jgi:PAS domain S-box-containing protein